MKIYYVTRTYPDKTTGGAIIRKGSIDNLRKEGFEVWIVAPNYQSNDLVVDSSLKHILIPIHSDLRMGYYFEKFGIWEDYLKRWADYAYRYLLSIITKEDIVFATSGGELAPIIVGHKLKEKKQCKFIINFHDPLDYSLVNGKKVNQNFHVSREGQELKYYANVDLIICSSKVNADSLKTKYHELQTKIVTNYFGYVTPMELSDRRNLKNLAIAYGGSFSREQSPEILAETLETFSDVKAFFIGKYQGYKPLYKYRNRCNFIANLPPEDYCKFLQQSVNVGFVSLVDDYLGACVPSKIYEYINLGLPILGALPSGDAMDIINQSGYGIACHYSDKKGLINAVAKFQEKEKLLEYQTNVLKDRDSWAMKKRIQQLVEWLKEL